MLIVLLISQKDYELYINRQNREVEFWMSWDAGILKVRVELGVSCKGLIHKISPQGKIKGLRYALWTSSNKLHILSLYAVFDCFYTTAIYSRKYLTFGFYCAIMSGV